MKQLRSLKIIKDHFDFLLKEYQESLKTRMERSDLSFDRDDALCYKFHKISLNRGDSYIDSPEWLKSKKATINSKNKKDDKCFQYAIAASNHQYIKYNPEKNNTKINAFINKHKWKDINFPSHKEDWNSFEKNSKSIVFNVLFAACNTR